MIPTASPGRRPIGPFAAILGVAAAVAVSFAAVDLDLGSLGDAKARARAFARMGEFAAAFKDPDLGDEFIAQAIVLTKQTLAAAILATALAAGVGYVLALAASRAVCVGVEEDGATATGAGLFSHVRRGAARLVCALARLGLDVLRAVPDVAWAVLLVPVLGIGPVTGAVALAINVTGILGKVYSELFDAVDPERYAAVRAVGAGRLGTFAYGIRPLASRSVLSFTLMRAECAIRNAAVIGVVGGGGLGSELMLRLGYGEFDKVATLLAFTLALTFTADLGSNFLRRQLRNDPNHPRAARDLGPRAQVARTWIAFAAVAGAIAWAAHFMGGGNEEGRNHLAPLVALFDGEAWARLAFFKDLLRPELTYEAVWERSIVAAAVPLSMAVVGTVAGTVLAILLAYPHSVAFQVEPHHFTGETPSLVARLGRLALAAAARVLGLVARAVPEVLWALIFVSFFGLGVAPGMVAIAVHSLGVLVRVFTETVDNIPYRRFEQAFAGSRAATFAYAGAPLSFRDWMTYAFFQLESNVRAGVVLGIVGAGGLGFNFAFNFEWFRYPRAATNLITIILLTVAIDRLSRLGQVKGSRSPGPPARTSPRASRA